VLSGGVSWSENLIRVLVAIKPVLYREAIAGALQKHRPHLEVRTVAPEGLDGEVVRFEPHLVFCHQATAKVRERVLSWVEVAYEDSIDAAASISGESSKIRVGGRALRQGCPEEQLEVGQATY
jgi:hypothetical protein